MALLVEVVGEDEGGFRGPLDDLERAAELADVLLLALAADGFFVRRGRVDFYVRAHFRLLEETSSLVQTFGRSAAHVVGVVGGDLDVRRDVLRDRVDVDLAVGVRRLAPDAGHAA